MKVKVIEEKCIGCGACIATCSEVFDYNDNGLATVIKEEVSKENEELVVAATETCPVEAIEITK